MLRLYNSLTRKIEEFKPIKAGEVGYYSCGPTVYDYAHIGHARTYIFADILQRVLEMDGYKVKRVMNITDVGHLTSDSDTGEDKMEKGAKKEGRSVWAIAKFYTDDFFRMTEKLNIKKPEYVTRATDYIKEMIDLVKQLEEKGFTYKIADGIYFDTAKFPAYGILTGMTFVVLQKALKAGARVELVSGKKNVTDFALWKLTPPGVKRQMEWSSPWGRGFPGWHIECSAMSMKILGDSFDIHTGGIDHIPIHHTNEIAQSEAASGKKFVNYWLHGQHLLVEGEKMSKSLGNFYRLKDIVDKGYGPLSLRYLFLTANYRSSMNFTWKALSAAQTALKNLYIQAAQLNEQSGQELESREISGEEAGRLKSKFIEAVNDDLNMPKALAIVWDTLKSDVRKSEKYGLLLDFDNVLGLGLGSAVVEEVEIPREIQELVEKRAKFREEKKFAESDKLRKEIENRGYTVEDTPVVRSVNSDIRTNFDNRLENQRNKVPAGQVVKKKA